MSWLVTHLNPLAAAGHYLQARFGRKSLFLCSGLGLGLGLSSGWPSERKLAALTSQLLVNSQSARRAARQG